MCRESYIRLAASKAMCFGFRSTLEEIFWKQDDRILLLHLVFYSAKPDWDPAGCSLPCNANACTPKPTLILGCAAAVSLVSSGQSSSCVARIRLLTVATRPLWLYLAKPWLHGSGIAQVPSRSDSATWGLQSTIKGVHLPLSFCTYAPSFSYNHWRPYRFHQKSFACFSSSTVTWLLPLVYLFHFIYNLIFVLLISSFTCMCFLVYPVGYIVNAPAYRQFINLLAAHTNCVP